MLQAKNLVKGNSKQTPDGNKMSKYYFDASEDDHEHCYSLKHFKRLMKENGVKEMTLVEAKPAYGTGFFYCTEYGEIGEVGDGCGKECKAYKPRNGKNGRCCFSNIPYEESDKRIVIKQTPNS